MTRLALAAFIGLLAAPAFAAAPPALRDLPIKTIVADPTQYLGDRIETEGYVIDHFGQSAQLGGTNQGIVASDTLAVFGPGAKLFNFFDRFRVEGILEHTQDSASNGSRYRLKLTADPQAIGR